MSNERKAKDAAMAAYMKIHGPKAPTQWHGCGSDERKLAEKMGGEWRNRDSSTWQRGMLGGVLAEKLGWGSAGI